MIEVRLLGRFSARRSGEEIPPGAFGGRLVRRLIRLLVTQRGRFVSLDVLAEALWPGRMPVDPAANLRVLVNRARSALGDPSLILTGSGGYSFTGSDGCVVDTELVLAAVAAGQWHLAAGEMGAALREFRSALDRWGGEPLAEDAYEEWAQEFRATLSRAYLQALEDGSAVALALRDPGQAVALAELAVAREPLRESAALLLTQALAAAGDSVGALRALDALRSRLAEEVGVRPSTQVLDLETRLQRGDPLPGAMRRPPPSGPRSAPAFGDVAFVGREAELHALLAAVTGPSGGIVLVAGSAGAGKSRLLAEAATRCEAAVVSARAFLPERDEPWTLARALLREALALDVEAASAIPERAAQALADILPELEELRPIGSVSVDPESRRALAFEGAVRLITAATAKGTLVLLDDIHWADATSLAVLGVIATRVPEVAFVLAYRPEEVPPGSAVARFLGELGSLEKPRVQVVVGPLPAETIALLVSDGDVVSAVVEETDCSPLAVVEVLRNLTARGVVEADMRGRFQPRSGNAGLLAREAARTGARRAIAIRAERLSVGQKQTLSLLALLGREVAARVVAAARDISQTKVLDELDALARAGLARLGEGGWATAHDLIAEVIAEGLDGTERGRLHQLLAQALQAEGGDASEIARHLAGAGDRAGAARSFSEAATRSFSRYAGDEARQLADSGLALDPDQSIRTALLRTRGEARALRGDLAGAREDLRATLAGTPRGPERARVLTRIAELTSALDDYGQAAELIDLALVEAHDDPAARAEALAQAAVFDVSLSHPDRAMTRADEALMLFEQLGDSAGVASILDVRANTALWGEGRISEGAELFDRTARLYRDAGRLLKVGTMHAMRGGALVVMGRPEEALSEIGEALELERMLGQTEGEAVCLWGRSEALCVLGRLEEARDDAMAALGLSRAVGNRMFVGWGLKVLADVYEAAGDRERAEATLWESLEAGVDFPLVTSCSLGHLASLLALRGDLTGAEEYAGKALRAAVGFSEYEARLVLAEVALLRGDPDGERRASEALEQAEAGGYRFGPTRRRLLERVGASTPSEGPARRPVPVRARKTFMFTDIVGSTVLVEALGDGAWNHLLRWHDQTLRALFAGHEGVEVNRIGDGFFVAFDRAEPAVRCAVEIQRALARHRIDHGFAPRVRIGLHQAEATREGADYQGRGVHEAARIAGAAEGDEILASQPVVAHVQAWPLSGPRPVSLKGLKRPVELFTIDWR